MKLREWLMVGVVMIGILVLMAILDRPVQKDCAVNLRDEFGHTHEYIGQIEFVCPVKGQCR